MEEAFETFFQDGDTAFLNQVKHRLRQEEWASAHELAEFGNIEDREQEYELFADAISVAARRPGNERFLGFLRNSFIQYGQQVEGIVGLNLELLGIDDIWNGEGGVWNLAIERMQRIGWKAYLENGSYPAQWGDEQPWITPITGRDIRFNRSPQLYSLYNQHV